MEHGNWFLALVVEPEAGLSQLCEGLPSELRRLAPVDLHLTVAFLGRCGSQRAAAAWQAISQLRHGPIVARSSHWRAMGSPACPSAWALTLAEGASLTAALIEHWREPALAAAGLPSDRRSALPHITLVRPPRRLEPAARAAISARLSAEPCPGQPLLLSEIALYGWSRQRTLQQFQMHRRRRLDGPEPAPGST